MRASSVSRRSSALSPAIRSKIATASDVFLISVFALISVRLWVCLKQLLSFNRALNVRRWNLVFLGQTVGENGHLPPMKKVEQPILNMPLFGAQFINAIPQTIRRRPPEFMAKLNQKLDAGTAIRPRPFVGFQEFLKPVHDRGMAIGLLIEHYLRCGHKLFTSQHYHNIAMVCKEKFMPFLIRHDASGCHRTHLRARARIENVSPTM